MKKSHGEEFVGEDEVGGVDGRERGWEEVEGLGRK